MTTRTLTAVLLAGLLTGCATQTWEGAGDFERDSYQCEIETYRAPGPPAYASPASGATLTGLSQSLSNLSGAAMYRGSQDALYARCMGVRGYRRVN